MEGWNSKLCSLTAARAVLDSVSRCAARPALLPPPVRRGSILLHAPSHLLSEEGHLMEAGKLGHYLYEEWGLEKKSLVVLVSSWITPLRIKPNKIAKCVCHH